MAANHFVLCLCLLGVLYVSGLAALGDGNHTEPWWFSGMQWLFVLLEAPVVGIFRLSRRVAPSSHPSFLLLLGLGIVWSLVVGYLYAYVRQRVAVRAGRAEGNH
jgi:NADH:ubiquinone oxidoreductase subunit 3 (subunit A)